MPSSTAAYGTSREDMALAAAPWVGANGVSQADQGLIPNSIVSKVFVFGKDQGYETTPDKFGEYRFLVRYPAPLSGTNNGDAPYAQVIPDPGTTNLPLWVVNTNQGGPGRTISNIGVNISFGDFYYKEPNVDSSFSYQISASGIPSQPDGWSSASAASTKSTTLEVWAREWSHKYVTQFYTDASLQTKIQTTDNEWYSYSALSSSSVNAASGTENSSISGIAGIAPSATELNNLAENDSNSRRWVAQFDGDGKKKAGTAIPCTSTFT